MKTKLIAVCIILAIVSLTGCDGIVNKTNNQYECAEWDEYVCMDETSPFYCCDVEKQECNRDFCDSSKTVFPY